MLWSRPFLTPRHHHCEGRPPAFQTWLAGCRPLHHLEVYGAGQWLEDRQGTKSRRGWRKLHLALDADSGEIIAHVMTDQDAGDASRVEPLLDQIDGPIGQFTADGAYDGDPTYEAVIRHSAGAAVVIPPAPTRWNSRMPSFPLNEAIISRRSRPWVG